MEIDSLEQVVRQYVKLGRKNPKGWEPCLHITCDHGKKGDRAAFRFDNGVTGFHCFNCGVKGVFNPTADPPTDKNGKVLNPHPFFRILNDFGVPEDDFNGVKLRSLRLRDAGISPEVREAELKIQPKKLIQPSSFYLLSEAEPNDAWAEIARYYLQDDRLIDPGSYPFMLSHPGDVRFKKWEGRLIIPVFKDDNLVFYQGRDLTDIKPKKYESPTDPKDCVIFGFDQLYKNHDKPLYVVEGVFDAMLLDGVALMGNVLSKAHISWLNKSPRRKVYIPDRFGDGKKIAEQCLSLGWHVSVPFDNSWDSSLKDITDMVHRYGKLFVIAQIVEHTATGFGGLQQVSQKCK